MDIKEQKPNLRSKVFTEELREKMARGVELLAAMRRHGVRALRTDYSKSRPVIEIDPSTADALGAVPGSVLSTRQQDGTRCFSKVIHDCEITWSVAA